MRLDRQRSQPRLLHGVNGGHDVALGDHVRQPRSENRRPPLRPAGSVTCRRQFSAPALLVEPHSRLPSLLRLLPSKKPLIAAQSSDRNACRKLRGLFGVVRTQQVGELPAGLSQGGQRFGCIGAYVARAPSSSPQSPPPARDLVDSAGSPHASTSSLLCHPDPVRRETSLRRLPHSQGHVRSPSDRAQFWGIPPSAP
jgi:hypothetical protein